MNAPPSLALSLIRSWTGFHRARVTCLSFSADGAIIASGDSSGRINLFRVADGIFLGALQLDAGVEPSVCTWQTSERLWVACSDGKVVILAISDKAAPAVVDYLPSQFPEAPRGIYLRTFKNACRACVYYAGTVELWVQRRGTWQGVGCTISPGDVVVSAVPVAEEEVLIVYRDEGMSVWSIRNSVRREVAGWRKGFVADFWAVIPVTAARHDPMAPACVAHIVAVSDSTLQSFGLFGDPFRHLYTVVEASRPSWLGGPCSFTLWGNVPTLLARSKSNIVAVDLLNSTYPAAMSTTLANRISQLIPLPDDQRFPIMLDAFSGQDGRHIAAIRDGCNGSEVTLWSASASGCGSVSRTADEFRGKAAIVRVHEDLSRHTRSTRLATARRWCLFSVITFSLAIAVGCHWMTFPSLDRVIRHKHPSIQRAGGQDANYLKETKLENPATLAGHDVYLEEMTPEYPATTVHVSDVEAGNCKAETPQLFI